MDEKAAPDILVFKDDIITAVMDMAKRQVRTCSDAESFLQQYLVLWAAAPSSLTKLVHMHCKHVPSQFHMHCKHVPSQYNNKIMKSP